MARSSRPSPSSTKLIAKCSSTCATYQHAVLQRYSSMILTDQGSTFMSQTLCVLYELLKIKSIRTSAHRLQSDGLVERINQMLKKPPRFLSSYMRMCGIGISAPCYFQYKRSSKPPHGFPHLNYCTAQAPGRLRCHSRKLGGGTF